MLRANEDPSAFLCHYTSWQAAVGSILPSRQIRASPLTWTNDPRENREWQVTLTTVRLEVDPEDPRGIPEPVVRGVEDEFPDLLAKTAAAVRGNTKVLCLTRDEPLPRRHFVDGGRGWGHSPMWAHYAGGHSGVCLVFDWPRLSALLDTQWAGVGTLWHEDVTYAGIEVLMDEFSAATIRHSDVSSLGVVRAVEEHVHRNYRALFFLKSLDWATELEYRWVLRCSTPGPVFADMSEALVGVVMGAAFPERELPLLRDLLGQYPREVELHKCAWLNGHPFLEV